MVKPPSPILDTWQTEIPQLYGGLYWETQPYVEDVPL